MTKIEWTERTWNPIVGCSIVSPGCTNCYAMKMAHRIQIMRAKGCPSAPSHYDGTTKVVNGKPVWTGKLVAAPDNILFEPLRRKKPTMWFVNSMSDLFHENVPFEVIDRVFAVMALTPQHTYQILTKRSARMRFYDTRVGAIIEKMRAMPGHPIRQGSPGWPLRNVWLGVSAEDQKRADERIPDLLATPAAVRFLSAEPLLGPIDFEQAWHGANALDSECWGDCAWCENGHPPLHNCQRGKGDWERGRSGLDWVIVGGESGNDARPMHPDWARSIRDQCTAAGVAFFLKQFGAWAPRGDSEDSPLANIRRVLACKTDNIGALEPTGRLTMGADLTPDFIDREFEIVEHVGKKAAGRVLDGREWNEMPKVKEFA